MAIELVTENKDREETYQKQGIVQKGVSQLVKQVTKLLKKRKAKTVLDLGCGTGRHCFYLAKNGFIVYGVDVSPTALKIIIRQLKGKQKQKIRLKRGNMTRIPFKKETFDAVICNRVLYHGTLKQIRKAIQEIHRVLKAGGVFAFNVLTDDHPDYGLGLETGKNTFTHLSLKEFEVPHHFFTEKEILQETEPFETLKIQPIYYPDIKTKKPAEFHIILEKERK